MIGSSFSLNIQLIRILYRIDKTSKGDVIDKLSPRLVFCLE